jgi:hypothetical protein
MEEARRELTLLPERVKPAPAEHYVIRHPAESSFYLSNPGSAYVKALELALQRKFSLRPLLLVPDSPYPSSHDILGTSKNSRRIDFQRIMALKMLLI